MSVKFRPGLLQKRWTGVLAGREKQSRFVLNTHAKRYTILDFFKKKKSLIYFQTINDNFNSLTLPLAPLFSAII